METVLHRFWFCPSAQVAWNFAIDIVMRALQGSIRPQVSWTRAIFAIGFGSRLLCLVEDNEKHCSLEYLDDS